jgi:hypothetical protein
VEGDDDLAAYEWVSRLGLRLHVAGGQERCSRLAEEVVANDRPFAVVMDGDYELARRNRTRHRRIIILDRYAIENYFAEADVVCSVVARLAPTHERVPCVDPWTDALAETTNATRCLAALDIACVLAGDGVAVVPRPAARLFDGNANPSVNSAEVQRIEKRVLDRVVPKRIEEGESFLAAWELNREVAHIFCSDLIFALVRRFVLRACIERGGRRQIDNRALFALLAAAMWELLPHDDHRRLRGRFQRAAADLRALTGTG